jgi:hypothetical protein
MSLFEVSLGLSCLWGPVVGLLCTQEAESSEIYNDPRILRHPAPHALTLKVPIPIEIALWSQARSHRGMELAPPFLEEETRKNMEQAKNRRAVA